MKSQNRLKFVATIVAGQSPASDDVADFAGGHPFLQGKAEFGALYPTPRYECALAPKQALPGDILVSVRAPVGAVNIANQGFGIGRGLGAVRADSIDSRYLRWVLVSSERWLRTEANGSTFEAITASTLGNVRFVHDELQTQKRIADYLDRETDEIDAMLAKMDELTDTLEARRDKVIQQNALGTFHPFSGFGGPLGARYDVILGKMLDGKRAARPGDHTLPYIRAANISSTGIDLNDVNEMPFAPDEVSKLDLRSGDLLVVEGGSVGESVLLRSDMPGWSFQKTVNRVRPLDGSSTAWLGYVLRAYKTLGVIATICSGTTIAHLTAEKLRALRIPDVAVREQQRIADHLDEVTGKIDQMLAKTAELKSLLIERRAALITDVVTGKKQVP